MMTLRILCMALALLAATDVAARKPQRLAAPVAVCADMGKTDALKAAGAGGIECGVSAFLVPDKPAAVFEANLQRLRASGMKMVSCNGFLPSSMTVVGPAPKHDQILVWADTAFRRAAAAGIPYIVFGSGGARRVPEGFAREQAVEQFVQLCRRLGPIAARYGVTVVIEPLNSRETNLVNSVTEGADIVRRTGHKNIRLLCDIFHMAAESESPQAIVDAGKYIRHCHVAEAARRTPPGVDGDDFRPYFRALRKIGYKGAVSIECIWKDFDRQLPVAVETLRGQMDDL